MFWKSLYVYGAWIFYVYICVALKIGALHNEGVILWMSQVNVQSILLWISPFLLRHHFSLKPKLTDLALLSGEQHPCTEKGNWTQHLNPNLEAVFNWYLLGKEKKKISSRRMYPYTKNFFDSGFPYAQVFWRVFATIVFSPCLFTLLQSSSHI